MPNKLLILHELTCSLCDPFLYKSMETGEQNIIYESVKTYP